MPITQGLCRFCNKETFSEFEICPSCWTDCPKCGNVPNKPARVDFGVAGYPVYCDWERHKGFYETGRISGLDHTLARS